MWDQLQQMTEIVYDNLSQAQARQQHSYNQDAIPCELKAGDQALFLHPAKRNRMRLEWVGPYMVKWKLGQVGYKLDMPGKWTGSRICHINLLKKWHLSVKPDKTNLVAIATATEEDLLKHN